MRQFALERVKALNIGPFPIADKYTVSMCLSELIFHGYSLQDTTTVDKDVSPVLHNFFRLDILSFNVPNSSFLIPYSGGNEMAELDESIEVELFGNALEVFEYFWAGRVVCRPIGVRCPCELVAVSWNITGTSWISKWRMLASDSYSYTSSIAICRSLTYSRTMFLQLHRSFRKS